MEWTQQQCDELNQASKTAVPCYLRIRALAVWHCAQGQSHSATARYLRTTRQSVGKWVSDFRHQGLVGLRIRVGRGRKPLISHDDVMDYVVQSPRNFGINRTRWTLELLAKHVPSLKGFTRGGVSYILNKLNVSYKRGQPHSHSPDPDYDEKKKRIEKVVDLARCFPDRYVTFYQDEVSLYRQPTQACLWHRMGRIQPKMRYSNRSNTLMRVVGYLNPISGRVHTWDFTSVSAERFASTLKLMTKLYPKQEKIYVVLDNWPVHFHPKVKKVLEKHRRLELVPLPTYAPWLNPIEKVWKWCRQQLVHAHPWSDDFSAFKKHVKELFGTLNGSTNILRYVGLSS